LGQNLGKIQNNLLAINNYRKNKKTKKSLMEIIHVYLDYVVISESRNKPLEMKQKE